MPALENLSARKNNKRAAALPLARILARRLAVVALAVLALQTAYTAWDFGHRQDYLATTFVLGELQRLVTAVSEGGLDRAASGELELPGEMEARYRDHPGSYGFELVEADGAVIAAVNPDVLRQIPPETGTVIELIAREDTIDGLNRHYGSQSFKSPAGDTLRWRVAILDDPAGVLWGIALREVIDHVSMPAVPLIVLMLATIWLVLRKTLRPLETAAAAVQDVATPDKDSVRLDLTGAPAEVVALGTAVNQLLDRLHATHAAQREFTANVAHELRTPLSLLTLELASIDDPAALRARSDTQSMTSLVNQLLAMARLEGLDSQQLQPIDIGAIGKAVVARLAPGIIAAGREIELVEEQTAIVRGQRETLEAALRSLVENAARVSPAGSMIRVEVGPGPIICVIDQGPGIPAGQEAAIFDRFHQGDHAARGAAGLGLAIVRRTMELHGGLARARNEAVQGARFTLDFSGQPEQLVDRS